MFSFTKLLVLAAIIGGVWYGFKMLSRRQYQREVNAAARDRVNRRERSAKQADPAPEDLVACPSCKAYVPAKGAKNCGRPDCPY
jgi:uncharacterized protein